MSGLANCTPNLNTLTIMNNTRENDLRIAIYQKPVNPPLIDTPYWHTASPAANGGRFVIEVPEHYEVYCEYEGLDGGCYRTNIIEIFGSTALMSVKTTLDDVTGARTFSLMREQRGETPNHIRVDVPREVGQLIYASIGKSGNPIATFKTPPTTVADLSVNPTVYLAVISVDLVQGTMIGGIISETEVAVEVGDTATVTGSKNKGYTITPQS